MLKNPKGSPKKMTKHRILIIDDDKTLRDVLSNTLSENNYTPLSAENGKDGLKMAQREKPDGIILDMIMPDMDGNKVLKQLKNHTDTKNIPVMILTGRDKSQDISTSLQLGAKDYIVKPLDQDSILIRINIMLAKNKPTQTQTPLIKKE